MKNGGNHRQKQISWQHGIKSRHIALAAVK